MRAVLGIDAAWTLRQPSGIALACETTKGWTLTAVAASYQRFHALALDDLEPEERPSGAMPIAAELLATSRFLCGSPVDIVAIDMPLSHEPIRSRRASDDAVSRAYGGRKCSTHSPSAIRPGPVSDSLRESFEAEGYCLATKSIAPPCLIEVYPHPALVELARAPERLRYKAARAGKYWPNLTPPERRQRLYDQWSAIVTLLESEIADVAVALPQLSPLAKGAEVQAYENSLDAVVCAWVATRALDGQAQPFGDDVSAIWIPVSTA